MMCGVNIQSPRDELRKVREDYLFHSLTNPKPATAAMIKQLRVVYSIDLKRYSQLKRQLPYIVCGTFTPPYRLTENFAYTETFILDFDHLAAKDLKLDDVRRELTTDPRVVMCFASPSRDGLKVLMHFKERCYDRGIYSLFYKSFVRQFARSHHLEQVVDERTSDATRACFVSVDPDTYYNPNAEAVDLERYVDITDPTSVADLNHEQVTHDTMQKQMYEREEQPKPKDPDKAVMAKIRQTLNPNAKPVKRTVYVPEQLDEIIAALKTFIEEKGITVTEIENIQYAKKIHARLNLRQAEVNLFYGKRGYSVVISPRRGTDDELNELLALTVRNFLIM